MKSLIFCSASILALAAVPAIAEVIDANGNGTYSLEEVVTAYPGVTVAGFKSWDKDESGELSTDELGAVYASGVLPR